MDQFSPIVILDWSNYNKMDFMLYFVRNGPVQYNILDHRSKYNRRLLEMDWSIRKSGLVHCNIWTTCKLLGPFEKVDWSIRKSGLVH